MTITFTPEPFCDAPLPSLSLALSRVGEPEGSATLTPLPLTERPPIEEGELMSYTVTLTSGGRFDLRVSSLSALGPYVVTLELSQSVASSDDGF